MPGQSDLSDNARAALPAVLQALAVLPQAVLVALLLARADLPPQAALRLSPVNRRWAGFSAERVRRDSP